MKSYDDYYKQWEMVVYKSAGQQLLKGQQPEYMVAPEAYITMLWLDDLGVSDPFTGKEKIFESLASMPEQEQNKFINALAFVMSKFNGMKGE